MKELRKIVKEVDEPKPQSEKDSKAKHVIAITKDVEGNDEHPYKATKVKKDKSKLAKMSKDDEAAVYEDEIKERVTLSLQKNKINFFNTVEKPVVEDAAHQDKGTPIMTPGQVDTMAKLTKERITGHHLKWDGSIRNQYFDLVSKFNAQIKQGAIAGSGSYLRKDEEVETEDDLSIIEQIKVIAEGDTTAHLQFNDGDIAMISEEQAKCMLEIYADLTKSNARKFEQTISRSNSHFAKMLSFAEQVGEE